jgi:hypothetical protein
MVYVVYDSKAEAYLNPLFFQSKGVAIRSFTEAANDKESQMGKYPGDYTLFELGSYDPLTAKFDLHASPVSVGVAIEFVKQPVQPVNSDPGFLDRIS